MDSLPSAGYQSAGYQLATPTLALRDVAAALDFYRRAFDAELLLQLDWADGQVEHAEIRVGDSILRLAADHAGRDHFSPFLCEAAPVSLLVYVTDTDAVCAQALAAGAVEVEAVKDWFYGDRASTVKDPFGYQWTLASQVE